MDLNEISDTLTAAREYARRLNNLDCQLENAEFQVVTTAEETEKCIEVTFSNLINSITQVLNDRRNNLIQDTKRVCILNSGTTSK